jgi:signal transduction histidine kinase
MRLFPQTVRARVTIAATVVAVVVLAGVGWGLAVNLRRELTDSLDEQLAESADHVAEQLSAGEHPNVDPPDDDWLMRVVDAAGDVVVADGSVDGDEPVRSISRRVDTPDGEMVVEVAAAADDITESVATLQRSLFVAVPLAAAALGALTWLLVGRTLRPVERIRAEVADIGGADLHRRVPVPSVEDEIGRLATTMNDMLGRVEAAQERQRRFVADASHELRGPLTRMRTELEVDLEHPATADAVATQRSVLEEVLGLQHLVDDLLMLARGDGGSHSAANAATIDVAELARSAAAKAVRRDGVAVAVGISVTPTTTKGRPGELERAISNLLDNAIRHANSSVRVDVATVGNLASVAIEDDGPGIPMADRDRVFERFARVDVARVSNEGGAGLGLSIARDIVERHGGTLVVDATYDRGARLVIMLPSG